MNQQAKEPTVEIPRHLLSAIYSALRSYEYGNTAPALAKDLADVLVPYVRAITITYEEPPP